MAKKAKALKIEGLTKEETAQVEALVAQINKDYGSGSLSTLSGDIEWAEHSYQTPTGSIGLDICLGPMRRMKGGVWQTGVVPGRIEEIIGPEGSGKTTLTLQRIANTQAMGGLCAFIDQEHNLDPAYAKKLGVNLDSLLFSQPDSGEQAMNIAITLVKSGRLRLIVIDSVAALTPLAEIQGDVGDASMGSQARLMSKSLRMMTQEMGRGVQCNVIFTNQIREKIGVMFGNPETTPGGRALKFYSSYRLDVRRGDAVYDGAGDAKIQIGHRLKLHVIKNKVAPPFRRCECVLKYGHGIDTLQELFDLAVSYQIITLNGSYHYYKGHLIANGRDAALAAFVSTPAAHYQIYNEVMTRNCDLQNYTPEGKLIEGRVVMTRPAMLQQFTPTDDTDPFGESIKEEELAGADDNTDVAATKQEQPQ